MEDLIKFNENRWENVKRMGVIILKRWVVFKVNFFGKKFRKCFKNGIEIWDVYYINLVNLLDFFLFEWCVIWKFVIFYFVFFCILVFLGDYCFWE